MERVEPFQDFLARTSNASPEQYSTALRWAASRYGLSADKSTEEFERMKAFVLSYYEGITPVCSFLNSAGQPVDCVPFDQQPAARAARTAGYKTDVSPPTPAAISGISHPDDPATLSTPASGVSLAPGAAQSTSSPRPSEGSAPPQIPPGTVPLVRVTLERLIPLGTLERFFHKAWAVG
jgi:hypothetical protein